MKRKTILNLVIVAVGLLACFGLAPSVNAQVSMTLETNFQNYLVGEPVWVRITLHNQSGRPLPFSDTGALKSDIFFEVEDINGKLLPVKMDPVIDGTTGFVIQPGRSHQIVLALTRCSDLRRAGGYRARAYLSHPRVLGNARYSSNQVRFNIDNGTREWPHDRPYLVGVPTGESLDNADSTPPRNVQLLSLHDGKDKAFYLNIEDARFIYAQIRIGYEIDTTRRPQVALDGASNIHILMYISPKLLIYFKFDIDGIRLERKVIAADAVNGTPRLALKDGEIVCEGGRPAKKDEYVEEPNNRFRATQHNYNP